ncbi:hypothetical protein RS030_233528 [Cryptosporidium xiaoi]|uniref:Uncharacterized protein n=1 Tax=Cryptosporidium xiaoi TaxID=659607 RepID=A0AAV9Y011_9CRYT
MELSDKESLESLGCFNHSNYLYSVKDFDDHFYDKNEEKCTNNVEKIVVKECVLPEKDFNDQIKKFKSRNDSKSSISPNDISHGKEFFKKNDDDEHDNKSNLKVLNKKKNCHVSKKSSNEDSENKIQESEKKENSKESKDKKEQGRIGDNNSKEKSEIVVSRNKKADKSGDKNESEKSDSKNKNKSDKTNKRMEKELEKPNEIKVCNKSYTKKFANHKSKTNSKKNDIKSDLKVNNKDSSELILLKDGNIKLKIPYRDTECIPKELFDTKHLLYLESNKLNKYNSYVHETSELFSVDTAFEYTNIVKNSNIQ